MHSRCFSCTRWNVEKTGPGKMGPDTLKVLEKSWNFLRMTEWQPRDPPQGRPNKEAGSLWKGSGCNSLWQSGQFFLWPYRCMSTGPMNYSNQALVLKLGMDRLQSIIYMMWLDPLPLWQQHKNQTSCVWFQVKSVTGQSVRKPDSLVKNWTSYNPTCKWEPTIRNKKLCSLEGMNAPTRWCLQIPDR